MAKREGVDRFSQAEVDAFMAAPKVVPAQTMAWAEPSNREAHWSGGLEVESVRRGNIFLRVNLAVERHWTFKIRYQGEEVYQLDVRPPPSSHPNPRGRPEGFERRVTCPQHEHVFRVGLGLRCARALPDLNGDFFSVFQDFCCRGRITFEPDYEPPPMVQLEL